LDLHNIPQGVFAKLYEAQSRGESTLRARAGLGTFIDPRVGRGSSVTGDSPVSFVKVAGDQLEFSLPKPEYCFFTLPYADAEGNLYARHAACYNECQEAAAATRANGGRVIACVSRVIPKSPTEIFMPASAIDHIVVHPWSEQAGTILQRRPWYLLTEGAKVKHAKAVARAKFLNNLLRVTPRRTALEEALARLAATQFTRMARRGNLVNIGVGLPEEVARVLVEESVADDITFMTEAGAIGGLPAPGLFFGAAISPKRLVGAAEAFHILEEKLDITVLGMVEADEQGNVNVSRRGPKASQFVGTGGFCDITTAARKILFVGSWMSGGSIQLTDRGLRLAKAGIPKFTARVSEITFCGQEALRQGKEVYFATCVGLFQLTPDGMTLIELMPGISLDELKRTSPMIIRTTSDNPPTISDTSILRGAQFRLARLSTG
jgi:propionate CoA-transferase